MSKRQQTIMTYMLSKILFFGLGISYCMSNARQNSWLAIILGYLLGLIILNFFLLFYIFSRINRSVTQCKTMYHSVLQTIDNLFSPYSVVRILLSVVFFKNLKSVGIT
jgi:hypothetical protein